MKKHSLIGKEKMLMAKTLKDQIPILWERREVLDKIYGNPRLKRIFEGWEEENQDYFLDICTGMRGVKVLYDAFFKEVMNPDTYPERLEELLSLILRKPVKILKILPLESARIAAEKTLLIMDIVIQLEDGSVANVEVQKYGYEFPGQRSACYSSDLLLRQYKRVRKEKGKYFKYRDIKEVYTIVFVEKSTKEFHKFPEVYIHRSEQTFDTGLKLELLQKYVFLPLDIYKNMYHNKISKKRNRLEAWLSFLSEDDPEEILRLIQEYPKFQKMYEEIYSMCRNMESFMDFYSEAIKIMEENTVQYMMDEMQAELDEMHKENEQLQGKNEQLQGEKEQLQGKNERLQDEKKLLHERLDIKEQEIEELKRRLELIKV